MSVDLPNNVLSVLLSMYRCLSILHVAIMVRDRESLRDGLVAGTTYVDVSTVDATTAQQVAKVWPL
jgi:hypothetical protein